LRKLAKLSKNYWVKSAFFTIAQRLSVPLFGVGSFLILIRSLNEEEMGTWVLFINITTIIEVVRNGLVKGAIVRFYNISSEKYLVEIKTASLIINIAYTIITLLFLMLGARLLSLWLNTPHMEYMFYFYSITAILFIPFSHFEFIQNSNMKFKGIFYSYATKQGCFFLLIAFGIILLQESFSVIHLVIFQSIGMMMGTVISYFSSRKYLSNTFIIRREWISKLWHFGKYGLLTNLSNSFLTTTDHLLIGGIVSTSSVATYNAAMRITNFLVMPSIAIADIIYPKSVKAQTITGLQEVKNLYEKAVGATLVPIIPIFFFILAFPDIIIELLAGARYLDSIPILRITVFEIIILPFLIQFGIVMNSINNPRLNFYFVLSLSCFNLLTNIFFVLQFGIIGAAFATLLSYFIGLITTQIILNRLIGSSLKNIIINMLMFYLRILSSIKNIF